jgi:hypothetical protein
MKKTLIISLLVLVAQFSFGQQFTDLHGDYLGQTPPGDTPVVFAPGIISKNGLEHSAAFFLVMAMKFIGVQINYGV